MLYNKLQKLPDDFLQNCAQLVTIGLMNNQLQLLPPNFLQSCPQLQELGLKNNQLQQLPNNFLKHNPKITYLWLSENNLPAHELEKIRALITEKGLTESKESDNKTGIHLEPQNKTNRQRN